MKFAPELQASYEELRGEIVAGAAGAGHGYGWAPLISRGMAAWMHAWLELRTACIRGESKELNGNSTLSSITRNELAVALASMALGVMKEATV